MKRRIPALILLLSLMAALAGCGNMLPLRNKPEDAVNELMSQDILMAYLSVVDDESAQEEFGPFWGDFVRSPALKSLLLENVRSISYKITNVSERGDDATVSVLVTHHDITPVLDDAFSVFVERLMETDPAVMETLEDATEEELMDWFKSAFMKAFRDAAERTKPTETFSTVRFELSKNELRQWELEDLSDEFGEKVLLMNLQEALEKNTEDFSALFDD